MDRITFKTEIRSGQATIREKRLTVSDILSYLAGGQSIEIILEDYPYLTEEDIKQVFAYARLCVDHVYEINDHQTVIKSDETLDHYFEEEE